MANGFVRGAVLAGKYRLEVPLGNGGMAVVWSAYHLELDIPVAIKLLRGGHDLEHERLKDEARAAARIAHPAIVRVLDVACTDDGDPFIVMELLTGETLADVLARGSVSALRVVQLMLPIAEGLALVHDHGVVHRDLKPENVFLATSDEQLQPKLLDFGIAKLAGGRAIRLTKNGMTLGSPSYMSPEQARGEQVDYLSDIWSFCVLLYKAIGGKAPFRGATAHDILDAILLHEAPPLPLGAGVDGHLARIVLSGLNKSPALRPASMRLLGQQLARWLLLHGVSVDACGAPLVSKWLSSDPPTKLGSEGPPTRKSPAPSPPAPLPEKASEQTTRELARAEPTVRRANAVPARDGRSSARKHRRGALWAVAGVLLAGGSLALTRPQPPKASKATTLQPTRVSVAEPPLLTARDNAEISAGALAPVASGEDSTNTAERAAIAPTVAPRAVTPSAPPARTVKSAAPSARPTLPF